MALRMPDAPQRYPLTLKAASLQSWSPTEAITTGATLSILRERSESAAGAAGGRGGGGGGGMVAEEGGRGGRAETCNHPNNRFYPFHPLWICVARWEKGCLGFHAGPRCITKCTGRLR